MNNLIRLVEGEVAVVGDDPWQLAREPAEVDDEGPLILPLPLWRARQAAAVFSGAQPSRDGVLLQPDDEPEALIPWLGVLPLIAIDFPSFRDGRGYSQATCCVRASAGGASCGRSATCCATSWHTCASAVSTPSPCARTSRWRMLSRAWRA